MVHTAMRCMGSVCRLGVTSRCRRRVCISALYRLCVGAVCVQAFLQLASEFVDGVQRSAGDGVFESYSYMPRRTCV